MAKSSHGWLELKKKINKKLGRYRKKSKLPPIKISTH
jgi:hypothetical protein